jgi:hypothetical protein
MSAWPLISRNKVEDSKVNVPVQKCTESENVVLKKAAEEVRMVSFRLQLFELRFSASFWINGAPLRLPIEYRNA